MTIRMAIDASAAATDRPTGVSQAIRGLVTALARLDRVHPYYLVYRFSRWARGRPIFRVPQDNFRVKYLQFPLAPLFRRRVALFHGPDVRIPRLGAVPLVATIHDLWALAGERQDKHSRRRAAQYRDAAERAARIIVYSETIKQDCVRLLEIPAQRLAVIPLAPAPLFKPVGVDLQRRVLERYALEPPYILTVGQASPRKNLERLIEAFDRFRRRGGEARLVHAGGGDLDDVRARIEDLDLADQVRLLGHVPQEDLPALYGAALLSVYVSLYEGFGLPPLESMACGTPVLAADATAIPEVTGRAAYLIDPYDVDQMAEALREVCGNRLLRRDLVERGRKRLKRYSWEKTARETLRIYDAVIKES